MKGWLIEYWDVATGQVGTDYERARTRHEARLSYARLCPTRRITCIYADHP
jgi:hypothetical protein